MSLASSLSITFVGAWPDYANVFWPVHERVTHFLTAMVLYRTCNSKTLHRSLCDEENDIWSVYADGAPNGGHLVTKWCRVQWRLANVTRMTWTLVHFINLTSSAGPICLVGPNRRANVQRAVFSENYFYGAPEMGRCVSCRCCLRWYYSSTHGCHVNTQTCYIFQTVIYAIIDANKRKPTCMGIEEGTRK